MHHARALAAWAAAWLVVPACGRHADLRQGAETGLAPADPVIDKGKFLPVGGVLDGGCAARPTDACYGDVDFPCNVSDWVTALAKKCQQATDCATNGSVEISLGNSGCVTKIAMTQPNDAMVACLVKQVTAVRCQCMQPLSSTYFFGLGNAPPCGSGQCSAEFPCAQGLHCVDGVCIH
jgi:hypothetical protein